MQTAHHASEDLRTSANKPKHPQVQAFERWKNDSFAGPSRLQNQLDETLYLAFCAGIEYSRQLQSEGAPK